MSQYFQEFEPAYQVVPLDRNDVQNRQVSQSVLFPVQFRRFIHGAML